MRHYGVMYFVGVELKREPPKLGCVCGDMQPFPANHFHSVNTPSYLSATRSKTLDSLRESIRELSALRRRESHQGRKMTTRAEMCEISEISEISELSLLLH